MGAHSCELFCNLGLCCLYGGQLDLVFPCFQRAIRLATTPEQRADVWYNLSFVALVCNFFSFSAALSRIRRCCLFTSCYFGSVMPWPNNYIVINFDSRYELVLVSLKVSHIVLWCVIFGYF